MSKTFDSFQKNAIKNAAKAVAHFQGLIITIDKQIAALEEKKKEHLASIDSYQNGVMEITGGYAPLELCEKVLRNDGKQSDWVFKYPDTIVPPAPAEAETTQPEAPAEEEQPATEEAPETQEPGAGDLPLGEGEDPAPEAPAEQEETQDPEPEEVNDPQVEETRDPMDDFNF